MGGGERFLVTKEIAMCMCFVSVCVSKYTSDMSHIIGITVAYLGFVCVWGECEKHWFTFEEV